MLLFYYFIQYNIIKVLLFSILQKIDSLYYLTNFILNDINYIVNMSQQSVNMSYLFLNKHKLSCVDISELIKNITTETYTSVYTDTNNIILSNEIFDKIKDIILIPTVLLKIVSEYCCVSSTKDIECSPYTPKHIYPIMYETKIGEKICKHCVKYIDISCAENKDLGNVIKTLVIKCCIYCGLSHSIEDTCVCNCNLCGKLVTKTKYVNHLKLCSQIITRFCSLCNLSYIYAKNYDSLMNMSYLEHRHKSHSVTMNLKFNLRLCKSCNLYTIDDRHVEEVCKPLSNKEVRKMLFSD